MLKTNIRYILLLIANFIFAIAQGQNNFIGKPIINYFGTEIYQAGTQNWEVVQDRRNILYTANNQGLLEFDGQTWQLHRLPKTNTLKSIAIGVEGRVYVGGQKQFGYFFPNQQGQLVYTSLDSLIQDKDISFDEIWDIYCTTDKVYFCSHKVIFVYQDGQLNAIQHDQEIRYSYFLERTLYVSGWDEGLLCLKNGELKPVLGGELFKQKIIRSIIPYAKDQYLIATLDGQIFLYNKDTFTPWHPEHQELFKKTLINVCVQLSNGNIAIGTQNNGLYLLSSKGEIILHLDKKSLYNQTVYDLYQDRFHNLWISLNNGLAFFKHNSPFRKIDNQLNVFGSGYTAYKEANQLYLGTSNGLYYRNQSQSTPSDQEFQIIPNTIGQVYNLSKVGDELLLGHHTGAYQIQGNQANNISTTTGAWLFQKLNGHPNYMIQGYYTGFLLYEQIAGKWVFKQKIKGFNESARLFAQDEQGRIWVSHGFKGVYSMRLNSQMDGFEQIKFYGKEAGFPSNILINLFEISGRIVFCAERGIYRYDEQQDRFVIDEELSQFFNDNIRIFELEEDYFGNIYFVEGGELGVLKKDQYGAYTKHTAIFDPINHLITDDLENITAINQSNIFIGAKEGFIHYNPSLSNTLSTDSIEVVIRNVTSVTRENELFYGGNSVIEESVATKMPKFYTITLPYDQNSLNIKFASPFYDGMQQVEYQYRLQNFDDEWSTWKKRGEQAFTNLSEGSYHFQVRAKNVYGNISGIETFRIIILPPWYRSTTSYIVYVLVFGAIIGAIVVYQKKKYALERQEMVKTIAKKEHELNDIAQKSEQQIEKLKKEKLKSEIEHKNQQLMLSTMHVVNKNEFLIDIKKKLQQVIKNSKNDPLSKELRKMTNSIDRNISDEREWQQFEEHFDVVHGDFFKKLRKEYPTLSIQDAKLCGYLRMEMTTKEMAQLLNLSVRGVETCRYRLRKKLGLEKETGLSEFLKEF